MSDRLIAITCFRIFSLDLAYDLDFAITSIGYNSACHETLYMYMYDSLN